MSEVAPAWVVRKSGINYTVTDSGSSLSLRPNNMSEAKMVFDNTDRTLDGVFSSEDEIDIYFGAINATNHMMVGYITGLQFSQDPSGRKLITLQIIDWGSYLAGKRIFENEFQRTTTPANVLQVASQSLEAGMSTNITGMTGEMKQAFRGTYVKDGFVTAVEQGKGDYFIDENKVLQAFEEGSRELDFGSGKISVVDDGTPSGTVVVIDHKFVYSFNKSAQERYRSVTVTNGLLETFPVAGSGTFEIEQMKLDVTGKTFSSVYLMSGSFNDWIVDDTNLAPVIFFPAKTFIFPSTPTDQQFTLNTVQLNVLDSTTSIFTEIASHRQNSDGTAIEKEKWNIDPVQWQNLQLVMRKGFSVQQPNSIQLILRSDSGFWAREIIQDLNSDDMTYLLYNLPTSTTVDTNGWIVLGTPDVITQVELLFTPDTGYSLGDNLEFGLFAFSRRKRSTVVAGGTPETQKIMIDSSAKNFNSLTALALEEQGRTDRIHETGIFTIDGDPRWKLPAYEFEVDFTNSLGNGTNTGTARIDTITHSLTAGVHKTTVNFKPSFARP